MATDDHSNSIADKLINFGFIIGLLLAVACLALSALYLYRFQSDIGRSVLDIVTKTNIDKPGIARFAITGQMYLGRVTLLSCGVFVGMAFGFLGFSLFLIGVKGDVNAEGTQGPLTIKLERVSPGLLVIICATILIAMCATRTLPFDYKGPSGDATAADNGRGVDDNLGNDTSMPNDTPTHNTPGDTKKQ
jgi:hypothetical protein